MNTSNGASEQHLHELGEQFAQWRATRTGKTEPIPPRLWVRAVELTEQLPMGKVAKTLRLSGGDLKRQCQKLRSPQALSTTTASTSTSTFIDLTPSPSLHPPQTQLLIQRPDGTRLTLSGPNEALTSELITQFWSS